MRLISNKTAPELHPHTEPSTNINMTPGIFEVVELIGCSQFSIFHHYHQKHGLPQVRLCFFMAVLVGLVSSQIGGFMRHTSNMRCGGSTGTPTRSLKDVLVVLVSLQ
jgi:hypothetical protein